MLQVGIVGALEGGPDLTMKGSLSKRVRTAIIDDRSRGHRPSRPIFMKLDRKVYHERSKN